jgi:hypothetical protein
MFFSSRKMKATHGMLCLGTVTFVGSVNGHVIFSSHQFLDMLHGFLDMSIQSKR